MNKPTQEGPLRVSGAIQKRSLKKALMLTVLSALIVLILLFYFFRPNVINRQTDEAPQPQSAEIEKTQIEPSLPDLDTLVGRWIRPDGGYVLEILGATSEGMLEAGYFNPGNIHVGRSEWAVDKGLLYVMVELQDVNYPGSTYGLQYDPDTDRLVGKYFQAVDKNTYDVIFQREK